MKKQEGILYEKSVIEFITVANEYCKFVENPDNYSRREFIETSHKLLPFLYMKAALFPKIEADFEEEAEQFVEENEWLYVKEKLADKLASNDSFIDIVNPATFRSNEHESISLAECLADIFQDLKEITTIFKIGYEPAMLAACMNCKNNFEQFWGNRLLATLNELHCILYSTDNLSDDDFETESNNLGKINTGNWLINQHFKTFSENNEFDD